MRTRCTYDRLSPVYGWLSDGSERPFSREALTSLLRPGLGEAVLDLGCGPGRVLVELAEQMGPHGRVVGVDLSRGMTTQARRRVRRTGHGGQVAVLRADAALLPIAAGSLDAVVMSFALELFEDEEISGVLDQVRRVLTPRGRVCVTCMASTGSTWPMGQLYRWAHTHAPRWVDCRPIDAAGHLTAAGFTVTERRRRSMWGLAVDLLLAVPSAEHVTAESSRGRTAGEDRVAGL